ncbi:hypothetical protein B7486_20985 [cyanobacterium TDX16]|nr:hypothetical protein B7486_20985 [cyanobacterium TDX16]
MPNQVEAIVMIEFAIKWGTKTFPTEYIALCISILAVVATWGNFWNSRRTFAAANYPKLRAELNWLPDRIFPSCSLFNESDKISANDIHISVSVARSDRWYFDSERWFTYEYMELARLKPLEGFPPPKEDNSILWCQTRGYKQRLFIPSESSQLQEIVRQISDLDFYYVRLKVGYTSNVFGANRICKISRTYRIECQQNMPKLPSKSEVVWEAREKTQTLYQDEISTN